MISYFVSFLKKFQSVVLFIFVVSISNAQIHRASNHNNYRIKYDSNFTLQYFLKKINYKAEISLQNENSTKSFFYLSFLDSFDFDTDICMFVWLTSIIGTFIVGICGVLPVFLLPQLVHDHHKLTESYLFKCLVSFAAGSLLGDVFLHLLPEAFSAKSKLQNEISIFRKK